MIKESGSAAPPSVFDPQTWTDLLTFHAAKNDMFSAKTLMVILDGVEQLAALRATPGSSLEITRFHHTLFERLIKAFNNPVLLKEAGVAYLEFKLPGAALKHLDLARNFLPKDRDIEQLQKVATIALAQQATDQPTHSGLEEAVPAKMEISSIMRKTTTRIPTIEARTALTEAVGALRKKTETLRGTGKLQSPGTSVSVDFEPLLNAAEKAISHTEFVTAGRLLAEARVAGAPAMELQNLYAQLGLSAFDHGRMPEALEAYLQVRDLGPQTVEGWFNCALVFQKLGQLQEALGAYREAARLNPENSKIWCNLSSVLFDLGIYDEAEKAARRSLELKPDYARAWDNLAAVLAAVNRLDESAEACSQAIRLQPTFHAAWFKLGVIHFQQENFVAAMEAFSWTGDSPDFFAYVLYYMAMIDARRGEIDEAIEKLAQARAADAGNYLEPATVREVAASCTRFARYDRAAEFYGQIVAQQPTDFSAWLGKGTAHHRAEQFDEARSAYEQLIQMEPDNSVPWHNLGLLAYDVKNHAESCRCFQRETEISPTDPRAWYDLGLSLQQMGREEESKVAFEQAEKVVKSQARLSSDLSAALNIVHRLNIGERILKER